MAGGLFKSASTTITAINEIEILYLDMKNTWEDLDFSTPKHVKGTRIAQIGPEGEIAMAGQTETYFLHPTKQTLRTVDGGVEDNKRLVVAHAQYFPQCFEV